MLVVVSKHTSRKGCNGMIVDFVTMYAWIFWVGLLLLFVIVEVLTVDFTFLMLAGGCVGGLVADLLGAPFWAQILIAGILALLLLFVARPALKRALGRTSDQTPTNVAALLGTGGMVTTPFVDGQGHVKLANGETWTARLSQATTDRPVDAGERVFVTAIEGATAIVVPAEGTAL
ncbi:membrane protein implicated in regulation of membrane protease activity [Frigoribacterium sp. UYMn621]